MPAVGNRTFHKSVCSLMCRLGRQTGDLDTGTWVGSVVRFIDRNVSPRTAASLRNAILQQVQSHAGHLSADELVFVIARLNHHDAEQRLLSSLVPEQRTAIVPFLLTRLRNAGICIVPATGSMVIRHQEGELRLSQAFDRFVTGTDNLRAVDASRVSARASALVVSQAYWNMCMLQQLPVSRMELPVFPPAVTSHMLQLRHVVARHCRLLALPDDIDALQQLEELDVNDNRIDALPLSLAALPKLRLLACARNRLTQLPGALFGTLTSLETLQLSGNRLTALPERELAALPRLRTLDTSGNCLTSSPRSLAANPALRYLNLSNNTPKLPPDAALRTASPRLIVTQ